MGDILGSFVRQARSVLLAGAIWFVTLWLACRSAVDPQKTSNLFTTTAVRIYESFGSAVILVFALAAVALLGAISQQAGRVLTLWSLNIAILIVRHIENGFLSIRRLLTGKNAIRRLETWEYVPVDLARRVVLHHASDLATVVQQFQLPSTSAEKLALEVYYQADRLLFERLTSSKYKDTYAQQLNELAQFRLSLVVPLDGLIICLATLYSTWWLTGLLIPIMLAFQAADFRIQRDIILENEVWPSVKLNDLALRLV